MFTKEELKVIGEVLSQLSFKPGQSGQILTVESILKKIEKELSNGNNKDLCK